MEYEKKLLENSEDTIDFLYQTSMSICFELHQANQRKRLTDYTRAQLAANGKYEIELDGQDEQEKIHRLQGKILEKCQDKNGNPRKFPPPSDMYNFIVIYVSGEIDGHIDKHDCMLTMYGVPFWAQLNIFGLCQHLSDDSPEQYKSFYEKFKHFRETIHGVLFVKNVSPPKSCYGDLILDLDLEYYLIGNNNLIDKDKFSEICSELSIILKGWKK